MIKRNEHHEKMTIWGVGPKIMVPGYLVLFVLSWIPTKISILKIIRVPRLHITIVSFVLICIGIILLAIGNTHIKEAFKTKKLVTEGVYSYVRNPMYVAHLFFIMPGICLLTNNAITLCSVICAMILFYSFVSKEEKALEEIFGIEYMRYKNSVGRLLPKLMPNRKGIDGKM